VVLDGCRRAPSVVNKVVPSCSPEGARARERDGIKHIEHDASLTREVRREVAKAYVNLRIGAVVGERRAKAHEDVKPAPESK